MSEKFYPKRRGPKTGPKARQEREVNPKIEALIRQCIERREALKLTQSMLAKRLGVSREIINRMETFLRCPPLDKFIRYADALGLTLVLTENP